MTCSECGSRELTQDPDVFDTWFTSALWPFATLGWPEQTPELERYYPTDVLSTARDIIFLWVARMMMAGHELLGEMPFSDVIDPCDRCSRRSTAGGCRRASAPVWTRAS